MVALTSGVLSLLLVLVFPLAIILGILAIILGIVGLKRRRNLAIIGLLIWIAGLAHALFFGLMVTSGMTASVLGWN